MDDTIMSERDMLRSVMDTAAEVRVELEYQRVMLQRMECIIQSLCTNIGKPRVEKATTEGTDSPATSNKISESDGKDIASEGESGGKFEESIEVEDEGVREGDEPASSSSIEFAAKIAVLENPESQESSAPHGKTYSEAAAEEERDAGKEYEEAWPPLPDRTRHTNSDPHGTDSKKSNPDTEPEPQVDSTTLSNRLPGSSRGAIIEVFGKHLFEYWIRTNLPQSKGRVRPILKNFSLAGEQQRYPRFRSDSILFISPWIVRPDQESNDWDPDIVKDLRTLLGGMTPVDRKRVRNLAVQDELWDLQDEDRTKIVSLIAQFENLEVLYLVDENRVGASFDPWVPTEDIEFVSFEQDLAGRVRSREFGVRALIGRPDVQVEVVKVLRDGEMCCGSYHEEGTYKPYTEDDDARSNASNRSDESNHQTQEIEHPNQFLNGHPILEVYYEANNREIKTSISNARKDQVAKAILENFEHVDPSDNARWTYPRFGDLNILFISPWMSRSEVFERGVSFDTIDRLVGQMALADRERIQRLAVQDILWEKAEMELKNAIAKFPHLRNLILVQEVATEENLGPQMPAPPAIEFVKAIGMDAISRVDTVQRELPENKAGSIRVDVVQVKRDGVLCQSRYETAKSEKNDMDPPSDYEFSWGDDASDDGEINEEELGDEEAECDAGDGSEAEQEAEAVKTW